MDNDVGIPEALGSVAASLVIAIGEGVGVTVKWGIPITLISLALKGFGII